jgi:ankyrin repeat protein
MSSAWLWHGLEVLKSSLMTAVTVGQFAKVQNLVQQGFDFFKTVNISGGTPLHIAAQDCHFAVAPQKMGLISETTQTLYKYRFTNSMQLYRRARLGGGAVPGLTM